MAEVTDFNNPRIFNLQALMTLTLMMNGVI